MVCCHSAGSGAAPSCVIPGDACGAIPSCVIPGSYVGGSATCRQQPPLLASGSRLACRWPACRWCLYERCLCPAGIASKDDHHPLRQAWTPLVAGGRACRWPSRSRPRLQVTLFQLNDCVRAVLFLEFYRAFASAAPATVTVPSPFPAFGVAFEWDRTGRSWGRGSVQEATTVDCELGTTTIRVPDPITRKE
ncbi:hypothetical protein B296_00027577 [Ensete ventricosum]|uniref:Uncharacterized protein n=1 Tax=Ensete ventricosum TaxID=4639 RepID=A0A426YK10_ENSVE|nr:hypothetical protein B296_00027577 [Ensete ventricosum]